MPLKLSGSITVETETSDKEKEQVVISAQEFGLEEDGRRHIGDGDYQYEALYMYSDDEERFSISFQATLFENNITVYPFDISGEASIVDDENFFVETSNNDFDDDY
jgi:hypothetical protein